MSPFPATLPTVVRQIRYQLLVFTRTPVAVFFTLLLPLMMLVLFNALFGDGTVNTGTGEWSVRQFYTGSLAAFAAVTATFTNLANVVPIRRDEGVLKRWRGTPLEPSRYMAGLVGSAIVVAAVSVLIMLTVGVLLYDLQIDPAKMPAAVVTFLVGVSTFAALGIAVAALCPTASAASAMANAIILPMAFVSDVFIPLEDPPTWLEALGDVLPLKPFAHAFQDAFNPLVEAPAFDWTALALVAVWGVVGLVVALRWFEWEPSGRGTTRQRRARTATATES